MQKTMQTALKFSLRGYNHKMHLQHSQATKFLSGLDPDWAKLIDTVGECTLAPDPAIEPFEALVHAVAGQQLHRKAAAAIIAKFIQYFGAFPTPQQVLDAPFADLRACGFSGRKIETLQGIASATIRGIVPTRIDAQKMSDAALIERLVVMKGIGQWTVEMLLIFNLVRMDVLPVDDFAVVRGYQRLKKLAVPPKRKEMGMIAQAWQPYRTIASWYLWRVPNDFNAD